MPVVEDPDAHFAERYRSFVATRLDRFEFFGVDPRGVPRRHRFDSGYVPLTLDPTGSARADRGGGVGVGDRADRALAGHRRALVRGVAGGGKSTLLRWLAVDTTRTQSEDARRRGEAPPVPFLLELGRIGHGTVPDLGDIVGRPLRADMPDGWAERMLLDGRAVLLLDGVDEVRPRDRGPIEDWVAGVLAACPETRCVVTTRPSVVAEQWWVDEEFAAFDLLPMSRHSVEQFVRGWHEMAREDYPAGDEARAWLSHCEQDLRRTLASRPALRGMSSNPLLAGLLCALHLDRAEHLPESRKQVYDAALELLLVRWPEIRRRRRVGQVVEEPGGAVDPGPSETRLSGEEQRKVLQRLAYSLVRNRDSSISHRTAVDRIRSMLFGLRTQDEAPQEIVRYLVEQTGVLRGLADGAVEFVHRTFRDHLAAQEIVEEDDRTLLLDMADKPEWHDVVVMAGAHSRPRERYALLSGLLDRARAEPGHQDTLTLLAAAVLEQSPVLPRGEDSDRDPAAEVRAALARIMPPATMDEADRLAEVGPFVLDLLPAPATLDPGETERVVRTVASVAARFDPPGALDLLLQYAQSPDASLMRQLIVAWGRAADYEAYAREILSGIDFRQRTVELQNQRRVDQVRHLTSITRLRLKGDVRDLSALADLPHLHRLVVEDNDMTQLQVVAGLRGLRTLSLQSCRSTAGTRPVDLSPLVGAGLARLSVCGLRTRVDLEGLTGAGLASLGLGDGALPTDGEVVIPHLPRLTHLGLRGRHPAVRGLSRLPRLRRLSMTWAPDAEQAGELNGLPDLVAVTLAGVDPALPLPRLRVPVRYRAR